MKIHFITSAHNSLSQRLWVELTERGHTLSLDIGSDAAGMEHAVAKAEPELIVAPMLKKAIPETIWHHYKCFIVHPGIVGDRGPSSLDWAITDGEARWGVTVLEADAEFDAGPIWASHEFSLDDPGLTKSSLYRQAVTEAAVRGVLEAIERYALRNFQPRPLYYSDPDVRGCLRRPMRQPDRRINWSEDATDCVVRKIHAGDSAPGVLDEWFGHEYFLYGAHAEDRLKGEPGEMIAQRDGAVCRATVDGAVWITHLKAREQSNTADEAGAYPGLKLPAALVLGNLIADLPVATVPLTNAINYRTYREISYQEHDQVGYLSFDFYNGAMSSTQCYQLRDAFLYARSRPTKVIVLLGGKDFWSNGIHLNVIEAAADPAAESWRNINAIDDLILEIINTMSHIVIAGMRGNAGAGGAMMALAADLVFARSGIVLNPHYRGMGGLYGSEYWTYTLPRRVGAGVAMELTENCRPVGTTEAERIGFIDGAFGDCNASFEEILSEKARTIAHSGSFWRQLREKHERRLAGECIKPLALYRAEELARMRVNFFGADPAYHLARQRFVYKGAAIPQTGQLLEPVARRA